MKVNIKQRRHTIDDPKAFSEISKGSFNVDRSKLIDLDQKVINI